MLRVGTSRRPQPPMLGAEGVFLRRHRFPRRQGSTRKGGLAITWTKSTQGNKSPSTISLIAKILAEAGDEDFIELLKDMESVWSQ